MHCFIDVGQIVKILLIPERVESGAMQIRAAVYRRGINIGSCKDFHHGVGDKTENTQASRPSARDPIVDLLNPKSIGFDRLSSTTTVPSFKSFRSWVFVLSR